MFDLLLKNGLVVDGSGSAGYHGDVGIVGDRIAAVGGDLGRDARQVVDVGGRVIAPGFIDPHTHFDAQLLWDGAARPSLAHGVTTVVSGNCSLSLAPLRARDRAHLVAMFRQIEELPAAAFSEAFEWTWESFADYLAALRQRLAINVAPLVGHSALRMWVLGDEAQSRAASPAEIVALQDLLRQCLAAGAVGLSTSCVDMDEHGRPVPSRFAHFDELDALCSVLGEYQRILQIVPEFYATDLVIARVQQLTALSLTHGITTTFSPLIDTAAQPNLASCVMNAIEQAHARGARVWPQVQTRPIDIGGSFAHPSMLFARLPGWSRILRLPAQERQLALASADTRAAMVAEAGRDGGLAYFGDARVRRGGNADDLAGQTLGDVAKMRDTSCARALIDLSIERNLDVPIVMSDRGHHDVNRIGALLAHPLVHVGAADSGAHLHSFATYGDTGLLFSRFVRGSGHLTLEAAVRKITSDTAAIWGLPNRGLLQAGHAADVVVFDAASIDRGEEYMVHDVPGNGMRLTRDSVGIELVLVNGKVGYSRDRGYVEQRAGVIAV